MLLIGFLNPVHLVVGLLVLVAGLLPAAFAGLKDFWNRSK
jgi:hypothetical protein